MIRKISIFPGEKVGCWDPEKGGLELQKQKKGKLNSK
jgi:hypothetical protein